MFKKVLLFVLLGVILIGALGCVVQQIERNDLVMVNSSIAEVGIFSSTGVYVFFFEDYQTIRAEPSVIQIQFDSSIDKPIVKIIHYGGSRPKYSEVASVQVIFKDKEQMKEYWLVK